MKPSSLLCTILLILSCHAEKRLKETHFFNLKVFFEQEANRLTKLNKSVNKSVVHNNMRQHKTLIIPNWKAELSSFFESDINKAAWRDSYRVLEDSQHITYTALDSNLRTRSITIKKNTNGAPIQIDIINKTTNVLYQTQEQLTYKPHLVYTINKRQRVILLGDNLYHITGKFN